MNDDDPLAIPEYLLRNSEKERSEFLTKVTRQVLDMQNSKLELRCPDHPNYRAMRKPKVNCPTCHELYGMVNGKSK